MNRVPVRTLTGLPTILLCAAWIAGLPGYYFEVFRPIKPLYWILATVFWFGAMALPGLKDWRQHALKLPVLWCICYSLLLYWQLMQVGDPAHEIINQFEAMAVFFAAGYAMLVHENQWRYAQIGILLGVCAGLVLHTLAYLLIVYDSNLEPVEVFHADPNIGAQLIVFGMICSWSIVPGRFRAFFALACIVGAGVTFSRGGWILGALALAGLLVLDWRKGNINRDYFFGIVFALLALLACLAWAVLSGYAQVPVGTVRGLGFFKGDLSDGSVQLRLSLMSEALRLFFQFPIFGGGIGSTTGAPGIAGPHNMYLLYAAEMGILGLLLYLWFIFWLFRHASGTGRLLIVVYAVSGLLTQTNFKMIAIMLLLAFAATVRKPADVTMRGKSAT